jgi:hypothetical protein
MLAELSNVKLVQMEGLGQLKTLMTSSKIEPRTPSSLYHSASTNYSTACPQLYKAVVFQLLVYIPPGGTQKHLKVCAKTSNGGM